MHRRWMDSPHHRENILHAGITQFGFGIVAGDEGPLYAVQTFAGPGASPGASPGTPAGGAGGEAPLAPAEADDAFARALNARRDASSQPPIEASEALSATAAGLLPKTAAEEVTLGRDALAGQISGDWASFSALAGSCGGCGAEITEADIDHFLDLWLEDAGNAERLLGPGTTSVGFALRAFGDGRKVAVAVLGMR
nr:hypothetical protein [Gemmatimonadota bacterium]